MLLNLSRYFTFIERDKAITFVTFREENLVERFHLVQFFYTIYFII